MHIGIVICSGLTKAYIKLIVMDVAFLSHQEDKILQLTSWCFASYKCSASSLVMFLELYIKSCVGDVSVVHGHETIGI